MNVLRMTMAEWKRKHRDFKAIDGGVRYALHLNPETGATESWPVEIIPEAKKEG